MLRALLATWFVLSVGEPSVVHICPMHASAASELADAGFGDFATHGGSGKTARHAGHHVGGGGAASHSHSTGQHQHHCTCINCCVGSASSALAASRVPLATPRVLAVVTQTPSRGDVVAREDPAHLLPPGTGPPRA